MESRQNVKFSTQSVIYLLFLLLSTVLPGCNGDSGIYANINGAPLTIAAVEQKPHIYQESGKTVGLDADITNLAVNTAGVSSSMIMESSFAEAYNKTKAGPNRVLIGINYSKERKNDFKWVGPTSKSGFYIFAKKSYGFGTTIGLEACKKIESIAVVDDGWLETTTLENLGFTNLSYYPTYAEAYAAFDNGDVKAIASEMMQLSATAKAQGKYSLADVDLCMCYRNVFSYMAFSKDVDDSVVNSIQASLNSLTTSGRTLEILRKYSPHSIPSMNPGLIQLFTEVAPPLNYYTGPFPQYLAAGSSVDIVNAIQVRLGGYISPITVSNWFNAYGNVLEIPNSALFTTARTADRENLFQWVGPIATMTPRFYALTSRNITATTLNDVKALIVSTPDHWFTYNYLVANGFGNIVGNAYTSLDSFNQLLNGTADVFLMDAESIDWLCSSTGTPRESIFQLPITDPPQQKGYIAFSLDTPQKTVDQWQTTLNALKTEGVFDRILLGWGLGSMAP